MSALSDAIAAGNAAQANLLNLLKTSNDNLTAATSQAATDKSNIDAAIAAHNAAQDAIIQSATAAKIVIS